MRIFMTFLTTRPALLLLLPASLLAAGCGRDAPATETPATPSATVSAENILVLEPRTLRSGPALSGDLVPEREAQIRAELGGSIVKVAVDAGQRVAAGQLLGAIDEAGVAEQHRAARVNLSAAESAMLLAAREVERAKRLQAGGAIAERDLEQAERSRIAAEAQLETARANLAAAEKQLQRTQLRAPFPGIVSERTVNLGDIVQAGNPLFTVVDLTSMRLEASVPVSALGSLTIGSTVDFDVSGIPGRTFTGKILRVNPTVDPGTRQVRLTVGIPNTGAALAAGLFARGRVATTEEQGLAVPLSSVDLRGAAPSVRRLRAGKVELVAVTLGLQDEVLEMAIVTAGLAAGDSILRAGAAGLAAGTPVVVTKE